MKAIFHYLFISFLFASCAVSKDQSLFNKSEWVELLEPENYLLYDPTDTSIAFSGYGSGTTIRLSNYNSEYDKVYFGKGRKVSKYVNYYIKKSKYRKLTPSSPGYGSTSVTRFSEPTVKNYISGERGGCYYLSNAGNRVYVDRSMCSVYKTPEPYSSYSPSYSPSSRSSSGGSVHVKGHYRKTSSGKTVYVKPHTRKK